ncbi:MAG: TonB-dependent receptor plug domain-containing protein [Acidobacteria bacterium]|nr:TonB-dependent receptor plug domain-containing protein [Acidobacteriota bacterium]
MTRVLTLSFLAALCVPAQDTRTHLLSGRVLDPASAAVANATIRLYSRDNSLQRTTASGPGGEYRLDRLPAGEYLLEASSDGLDQAKPVTVHLSGRDAEVDLKLEIGALATRVLVTASSTPQSTVEAGKAMDIIDNSELSRRDEIIVGEAVRLTPGLRVQQLGGPGSFTRIQIRGLRAADTGLLMDGMRFRDVAAVQGDATGYLGDLQLVAADRIEVLRGLGSTIYGTNATAGVINVVTDQGGGPVRGELSGEGGGLGLFRGLARVSGGVKNDRLQYTAGLARLNVDGGVDGVESVGNTSGQGYLLWRPSAGASLSGRVFGAGSRVGINSSPAAAPASNLPSSVTIAAVPLAHEQMLLGDQGKPFQWGNATFGPNFRDPDSSRQGMFVSSLIQWNQQVAPRWSYRASYQAVVSNRDSRNGPMGLGYQPAYDSSSVFAGRLDTVQARTDLSLTRWNLLSAGYEWEREFYENPSSDANPNPAQRVNARASATQRSQAVFVQDQMRLLNERLQVALSGRFQNFDLTRPQFEGGAVRRLTPHQTLTPGMRRFRTFCPTAPPSCGRTLATDTGRRRCMSGSARRFTLGRSARWAIRG